MSKDPITVVVFLRGGADGLNLISPTADPDFIAARPESLRVMRTGDDVGFAMNDMAADVDFRFHSQAQGLSELYNAGELAVIHASGLTDGTRSHFDAESRMERAAASGAAGGWLARWANSQSLNEVLPLLAVGDGAPDSLIGAPDTAVASTLEELIMANGSDVAPALRLRLGQTFGGHPLIGPPLLRLIQLSKTLETRLFDADGNLLEHKSTVEYPGNYLSEGLQTVASAIKFDLGLRAATIDFGGWDTHDAQEYDFGTNVDALSSALMAFWRDLGPEQDRVTVVVMSEFGRRLRSNTSGGTDHGFGNAMMVLGGGVRGGKMYGDWPGLANDALDDGTDLAITTDYRHVLAEVMQAHMGADNLSEIFPDFAPQPLGMFG